MDGKEQTETYGKLSPWQPDQLAGFRIGDTVRLPGVGQCEVTGLKPPALLQLRTQTGKEIQAGWRAVQRPGVRPR